MWEKVVFYCVKTGIIRYNFKMTVEEERQLERECNALNALFSHVVGEMKVRIKSGEISKV